MAMNGSIHGEYGTCGVLPWTPRYHTFTGGPGGVMFTALQVLDMYSDDLYFQGGTVTLCADEPWLDPTLPQKVYFEMKMYAGYQHLYTLVYNEDGEYVATVYPAQGLRETTWIETSCAGPRLRGVAETVQRPTLEVDIEVEGNLVPPAVAGHFTFPKPDGCAGARKYYTCAVDNPAPEPDTPTELIAVTAVPQEGFCHERWKGEGPVFDEYGNERTDVALDAREDEPERWVTDETIYLKCLESRNDQIAWAVTDMAALAGASVKGAISGGSKPASRKVTSICIPMYGTLIRGGDFDPPTKFRDALPKLRFCKDLALGYDTRWKWQPTIPQAINLLNGKSVEVFEFVGHGYRWNPLIVISHEQGIRLSPDDVNGKMLSPFNFLFFNTCFQALYKNEWMEAFGSESFVGWKTEVYWDVAEAFDNALWAFLANKDDEDPDVFLAYFAARRTIERSIVEGVRNEPDYGGDYTFPGRVN